MYITFVFGKRIVFFLYMSLFSLISLILFYFWLKNLSWILLHYRSNFTNVCVKINFKQFLKSYQWSSNKFLIYLGLNYTRIISYFCLFVRYMGHELFAATFFFSLYIKQKNHGHAFALTSWMLFNESSNFNSPVLAKKKKKKKKKKIFSKRAHITIP